MESKLSRPILDQAAIKEICDVLATTNSQVAFQSIAEEDEADLAIFLLTLHHTSDELAKHASEILLALPPEKQATVAENVVKTEMADIDKVKAITHRIIEQITEAAEKTIAFGDGKTNLINMLSDMSQEDRGSLLESLEVKNEDLVTEINQTLFPFDDLTKLDDDAIGTIINYLGSPTLSVALHNVPPEVQNKFFDAMDQEAAEAVKSRFSELSFTEKQTATTAQKSIVDLVQRLAAKGFIKINS
ncbi:MAG: FliG C-terminal domain-containing protein [Candidatus Poribacteria bacterium]|jgi:flagellar motor switch protein FliG